MKTCCATCLAFHPESTSSRRAPRTFGGHPEERGDCRRFAPKPLVIADTSQRGLPIWPAVWPSDWCIEWRSMDGGA